MSQAYPASPSHAPGLRRLELTFPSPAENLAADEALLDWCEAGHAGELLRFWEPAAPFVVLGYANKAATEVNLPACAARGVPVFRRSSGGGTVLQLPGGLNYSLILRIKEHGTTRNISTANQYIMERNCAAIQAAFGGPQPAVSVRGHTDLAITEHGVTRKVAGNAQRRRKDFLLFHGTFLLDCDLSRIGELLRMPSQQPEYRAHRAHGEFVTNLKLSAAEVKAALAQAWHAATVDDDPPRAEIAKLTREKYLNEAWNFKF